MPSLTLRDVPEELHAWLKQQADIHRRSVNKEVIALLEAIRDVGREPRRPATAAEIVEIGRRCAALPVLDDRKPDEILGYDRSPQGLPG